MTFKVEIYETHHYLLELLRKVYLKFGRKNLKFLDGHFQENIIIALTIGD